VIECAHGSDPNVCPPCQGDGGPPARRAGWDDVGPSFPAGFDGWCSGCADSIKPGEPIRAVRLGRDVTYRHDDDCLEA